MEQNQIQCGKCNKEFSSSDALAMHLQNKHAEVAKESFFNRKRKKLIKKWIIRSIVIIILISLIYWFIQAPKTLPPTTHQGHIEESPATHILKEPMTLAVQKHMLEHSDGDGPPGKIINYNCIDYVCESDLIEKLEAFAKKYTKNVYVAPFDNMDAKIVLTKNGKLEILESYDEQKIDTFIRLG